MDVKERWLYNEVTVKQRFYYLPLLSLSNVLELYDHKEQVQPKN